MKNSCNKIILYSLLVNCFFYNVLIARSYPEQKPPRLTLIFIVDQLAAHYFSKLENYFTGGFKYLTKNGVIYNYAYWPHAMPSTAAGHAGLNTGTFPKDHGIIGNSWYTIEGKEIKSDHGADKYAVFSPDGTYDFGKSPQNIMVDGISDQLMLQSQPNAQITVLSLSLKDRSAICTANKLGKAIWFDTQSGFFTSSKAYFEQLPSWLVNFNKTHDISKQKITWKPAYYNTHDAYKFNYSTCHDFSRVKESPIGKEISTTKKGKKPYGDYLMSPAASNQLLELTKQSIKTHLSRNKSDRLVLWVSLSNLDKIGHVYGPYSKEVIDSIYHIDRQIKQLIKFVERRLKRSEILYALTSDHGIEPAPEYLQKQGLTHARRINSNDLAKKISTMIAQKHNISLTCTCKVPFIYIHKPFDQLNKEQQSSILNDVISLLEKEDGIKKVWRSNKLADEPIDPNTIENYYKNQLFADRNGQIIFQVFPYNIITRHQLGTNHKTPYEWNTHVPLILYQREAYEYTIVNEKVSMLQFANSLAQIHDVPRPSASTFAVLPGLVPPKMTLY